MDIIFYALIAIFILSKIFKKRDDRISPQRMNEIVDKMNQGTQDFYKKYNPK